MQIYRIILQGKTVGVVASLLKSSAQSYAMGRYGAGADVEIVAADEAVDAVGLCVIVETKEIAVSNRLLNKIRVIA